MLLRLRGVHVSIGEITIIHDVSLEVRKGEVVALLGSNGAGKTTLFKAIAGVIKPSRGAIEFEGEEIQHLPADKVVQRGLVLCPEGRQLFPQLSVYKNLLLGAYVRRKEKKKVEQTLEWVYALFPILRERREQPAGTLSGGEQQMLAIGRALMSGPKVLLLDEPTMGLAPLVVARIAEVIKEISKAGTTVFLSEQNAHMALKITERGYVLENGRVVLEGPSARLIEDPVVKRAYLGV
ncbi:ABC transporter ATP-binding protein [Desulfovirgula thermocuniculi]|uniref:ABC transporter ATP-binding protein n=1 Tax=Desulfovirgula thermocuniculi TaxID=348842 RepID=UPI000422D277